ATPSVPDAATRDALVGIPTGDGRIIVVDIPDGVIGRAGDHAGHTHAPAPQQRELPGRGFAGAGDAFRGASQQREQQQIEAEVKDIQAKFAALGIRPEEGNGPVKAYFQPDFPNAAYAPDGIPEFGSARDSITVGVDPRSGQSFGESEDVIAHELAHRVVDHMTKHPLSMNPTSEDVAIHESLADTFAALVDDDDPWTLGEDLVEPVRIMDHPERLGHPGNVSDLKKILVPGGEHMVPVGRDRRTGKVVEAPDWHVVAGIPNKAASMIGKELGKDELGKIYINAIRKYLQPGKEIEGLASATLKSAEELYGAQSKQLQTTKDAWDAVGVLELLDKQH
ncbi:MAG: M4 family metallopeptidase, partial [Thermoleophilia bacterium]|nr:M4 family metallopeptidase [Thermoleophilia bacterium]